MSFDLTSKFNGSTDNNQFPDALTIVVVEELQVNVCPLRVTLSQPLASKGRGDLCPNGVLSCLDSYFIHLYGSSPSAL